ncbi:DUF1802 family protein [Luteolibacter sp. LG18]|uniref:DUF1802 family protein n=1 Tax=Luteolibacter sp. LG18 TaxID=2819286 RepID=UPI002B307A7E|nr:hypothetical protein llg_07780 [Luteolibacter sp. LG18]
MSDVIGFKEWQVVCDALASGRQTVILRKGGIHEGRAGFSFAHESFFLFPTRFHAQGNHVTEGAAEPMPEWQPGDTVRITHHAKALWARTLTDWNQVDALTPYHIYAPELVRERFDWEGKGMTSGSIHVALLQVSQLAEPWEFPYAGKYGGCRSWVNLPAPPENWEKASTPVIDSSTMSHIDMTLGQIRAH